MLEAILEGVLSSLAFNSPLANFRGVTLGIVPYCGPIYRGCITAILVGAPGKVSAAATMLEGLALTAKGESRKALDMATIASFIGGIFSVVLLVRVAPSEAVSSSRAQNRESLVTAPTIC